MVENEILVQSVTDNKEMIKASIFLEFFQKRAKYIYLLFIPLYSSLFSMKN